MIFQFHYGSVKSNLLILINMEQVKFQFHYGSVKRIFASETA